MGESIVCHENELIMNSEECSELDTTSTAMMFSNDHHVIMIMDTSSMMDKKCSIYCYFSSTYEASVFGHYLIATQLCTSSKH